MNLKEFVKEILIELNDAVDEARVSTSRDIRFSEKDDSRTVEFDIAVSAENTGTKHGKAEVKVLQFAGVGGNISNESKNSTVSHVRFGLQIEPITKKERAERIAASKARNESNRQKHNPLFSANERY